MVSRELVVATITRLLTHLHNAFFERSNIAGQMGSRQVWEEKRESILTCLDTLATWHHGLANPRNPTSFCDNMLSTISCLAESGSWYKNRLVFVWYLKHVLASTKADQLEKELTRILQDFTEEDLAKVQEPRGANAEDSPRNLCARLMYVAPLLLPEQVKAVVESHLLEVSV